MRMCGVQTNDGSSTLMTPNNLKIEWQRAHYVKQLHESSKSKSCTTNDGGKKRRGGSTQLRGKLSFCFSFGGN